MKSSAQGKVGDHSSGESSAERSAELEFGSPQIVVSGFCACRGKEKGRTTLELPNKPCQDRDPQQHEKT